MEKGSTESCLGDFYVDVGRCKRGRYRGGGLESSILDWGHDCLGGESSDGRGAAFRLGIRIRDRRRGSDGIPSEIARRTLSCSRVK